MTTFAIDTSVAVPLLLRGHAARPSVLSWADEHDLVFAGHAGVETYSVLTRLPDPYSIDAASAFLAVTTGFGGTAHPRSPDAAIRRIMAAGITGGGVYDALVAIAAVDADLPLASRDARAIPSYARMGARIQIVP